MRRAVARRFSMTFRLPSSYSGGIILSVLVFFLLYWLRNFGEALLGGVLVLGVFTRLGSRVILYWALVVIAALPVFYLLDRPAQAERVGVVAFSLLGLGILVNAVDSWRARHAVH